MYFKSINRCVNQGLKPYCGRYGSFDARLLDYKNIDINIYKIDIFRFRIPII